MLFADRISNQRSSAATGNRTPRSPRRVDGGPLPSRQSASSVATLIPKLLAASDLVNANRGIEGASGTVHRPRRSPCILSVQLVPDLGECMGVVEANCPGPSGRCDIISRFQNVQDAVNWHAKFCGHFAGRAKLRNRRLVHRDNLQCEGNKGPQLKAALTGGSPFFARFLGRNYSERS